MHLLQFLVQFWHLHHFTSWLVTLRINGTYLPDYYNLQHNLHLRCHHISLAHWHPRFHPERKGTTLSLLVNAMEFIMILGTLSILSCSQTSNLPKGIMLNPSLSEFRMRAARRFRLKIKPYKPTLTLRRIVCLLLSETLVMMRYMVPVLMQPSSPVVSCR